MSTLLEDIANVTGSPTSSVMSMPPAVREPPIRRWKKFQVSNETFLKLKPGLTEWKDVLSPVISEERAVLEFAAVNLDHTIVVENVETRALRAVYPY